MRHKLNESYFPDDELTLFDFTSHMQDFMQQLFLSPVKADIDDYLKGHGVTKKAALDMLLYQPDPQNPNSAVLICKRTIKPEELSEEDKLAGKTPKDNFGISYKLAGRDGYKKKMARLYINNFEKNIIEDCPINEANVFTDEDKIIAQIEDMDKDQKIYAKRGGLNKKINEEDGATAAAVCNDGAPIGPLSKPLTRTFSITEDQLHYLQESLAGDIGQGYTAPFSGVKPDDPTMNHNNIFKSGIPNE